MSQQSLMNSSELLEVMKGRYIGEQGPRSWFIRCKCTDGCKSTFAISSLETSHKTLNGAIPWQGKCNISKQWYKFEKIPTTNPIQSEVPVQEPQLATPKVTKSSPVIGKPVNASQPTEKSTKNNKPKDVKGREWRYNQETDSFHHPALGKVDVDKVKTNPLITLDPTADTDLFTYFPKALFDIRKAKLAARTSPTREKKTPEKKNKKVAMTFICSKCESEFQSTGNYPTPICGKCRKQTTHVINLPSVTEIDSVIDGANASILETLLTTDW